MGTIVKCPQCNEVNIGSQLYCIKCQTSLVGIPREQGESPIPEFISPPRENYYAKPLQFKEDNKLGFLPYFLGGISFIPLCGVPFGIVSIIWGLFTKKRGGKILAIIGALGIAFTVILYSGGARKSELNINEAAELIDKFMKAMDDKDVELAYSYLSPSGKQETSISEIERLAQGNYYLLFSNYKSVDITLIQTRESTSIFFNKPKSVIAQVQGSITYDDGLHGKIDATFELVDDKWLLLGVNVTAPPEKFEN